MKFIQKKNEPANFRRWKEEGNQTYDDLINPLKAEVKEALAQEQYWLCCYCECRLESPEPSYGYHIEHLIPQSDPNEGVTKQLDYTNLLCSCLLKPRGDQPNRCGHAKGDKLLAITPLQPNCSSHFSFNRRGEMTPLPVANEAAADTITTLQLNSPLLISQRKAALRRIESFLHSNSPQERPEIIKKQLEVDTEGRLRPHWSAIKSHFSFYLRGLET